MKRNNYTILLFCVMIGSAYSQLLEDLRTEMVPNNIHGQLDFSNMSLFDPQRFDIQQGFSMSMMSMGNQSVSVAGYTNKITYWANDNLRLNANILLYQPSINSFNHQGIQNNGPKIAFDAGLVYQPTENSFLQINFQNLPNHGMNNRFNNNTYRRNFPSNYGLGIY